MHPSANIESGWLDGLDKFHTLEMKLRESSPTTLLRILSENDLRFFQAKPDLRELMILLEIEKNPNSTQYTLAQKTGLAPSMVFNYLRSLKNRGLIQAVGPTRRRTLYYLTPQGESTRWDLLTMYFSEVMRLYQGARDEFRERLQSFRAEGIRAVVFYGAGVMCEVCLKVSGDVGFDVMGVVDSDPLRQGMDYNGVVILSPDALKDMHPDAIIITSLSHREEIHKKIKDIKTQGKTKIRFI